MKFLYSMFDQQLQKTYNLYAINAKVLSERLYQSYNLPKVTLHLFNSDVELQKNIMETKEYRKRGFNSDSAIKKTRNMVKKIQENDYLSPLDRKGILFGYELMPIAVSVQGDLEDLHTSIELIDGFKRMFVMDQVPDMEILVKVYDQLSDREWINAMITYNSWKFAEGQGCRSYMDRGFQLGLFHRYGIEFVNMDIPDDNIYHLINIYTSGSDLNSYRRRDYDVGTYATLWDNDLFHHDIKKIHEMCLYNPVFRVIKRTKTEEVDTSIPFRNAGISRLRQVFASILGEIRRYEQRNNIANRQTFDLRNIRDYFADPQLQKDFIKISNMTVDGFRINYIEDHLREDIRKRMYEGMGYPYTPPVSKHL